MIGSCKATILSGKLTSGFDGAGTNDSWQVQEKIRVWIAPWTLPHRSPFPAAIHVPLHRLGLRLKFEVWGNWRGGGRPARHTGRALDPPWASALPPPPTSWRRIGSWRLSRRLWIGRAAQAQTILAINWATNTRFSKRPKRVDFLVAAGHFPLSRA